MKRFKKCARKGVLFDDKKKLLHLRALGYIRHVEIGVPLDDKIREYNEDDARAVKHLIEKCFKLRKCATISQTL